MASGTIKKLNLVIETVTAQSHSIPSQEYATGNVVVPSKQGYTILGVVGSTAGAIRCVLGNVTYAKSSQTISYVVANWSTTATQTAQPHFDVLYSKL